MKGVPSVWRSMSTRVIALGVVLAVVPIPVAAAGVGATAAPVNLHAAVAKAAATEPLVVKPIAAAQQQGQPQGQTAATDPRLQSPSFFKTPLGLAVIGVVGAGVGYAIYSASHDRIHSPVR